MIDQFPELLLLKNCNVIALVIFENQIYRMDSFISTWKFIPSLSFSPL